MVDTYKNYAKNNTRILGYTISANAFSGDLLSAFQSCNTDGFWIRYGEEQQKIISAIEHPSIKEKIMLKMGDPETRMQTYWPDQKINSHALRSLLNKDPHALDLLTSGTIALLISTTNSAEYSDPQLLERLKERYVPGGDPQFTAYTAPKYAQLFHQMNHDPLIRNAEKNWGHYTEEEKVHVAERIGQIQSSLFGYKAYDVSVHEAEEFKSKESDEPPLADAGEKPDGQPGGNIRLNRDHLNSKASSFPDFINTIVHENDHAFQQSAAQKLSIILNEEEKWMEKNKKNTTGLKPQDISLFFRDMAKWTNKNLDGGMNNPTNSALLYNGELRSFAYIMLNTRNYYESGNEKDNNKKYHNNPNEKHSWMVGDMAGEYFSTPRNERADHIENLNKIGKDAKSQIEDIKADISHYKFNTPCNTIPAPGVDGLKWE